MSNAFEFFTASVNENVTIEWAREMEEIAEEDNARFEVNRKKRSRFFLAEHNKSNRTLWKSDHSANWNCTEHLSFHNILQDKDP